MKQAFLLIRRLVFNTGELKNANGKQQWGHSAASPLMSTIESGTFGIFRSVIIGVAGETTLTIDIAATTGKIFQLWHTPAVIRSFLELCRDVFFPEDHCE
jgi:hypothetical protein